MGSSKPPNQDEPFGYSSDVPPGYPHPSPPAPAPGPSLLDDNESNFLNSFFDGVNSDHYNADLFPTNEDGMNNMSFWTDIPPDFMGTTSSFGQTHIPQTNDTLHNMLFPDMSSSIASLPTNNLQTTEEDVRAAASLLRNGLAHNNLSHHIPSIAQFVQGRPNQVPFPRLPNSNREATMQYGQPRQRNTAPNSSDFGDPTFRNMVFGSDSNVRQGPRSPHKSADIRWGSDAGFGNGQGFVAPLGQKSLIEVEEDMMQVLGGLQPHSSTAASTTPNSPIVSRHVDPLERYTEEEEDDDGDDDSRPLKRHKSSKMKEEDRDDDAGISHRTPKKRRPKSMGAVRASSSSNSTQSPPPSKRRKSTSSSAAKASRENLTEDQKRENHIKSEQKRRTLIKEGFDDLGELVPDLRGGGHSKSAVLVMAADWLEDLIKGNEELVARRDALRAAINNERHQS